MLVSAIDWWDLRISRGEARADERSVLVCWIDDSKVFDRISWK
jgi:hypothetical protein